MAMAGRQSAFGTTTRAASGAMLDATREPGHGAVEAWLWFVAALVFAMIVVGGATRLTDSGLSITEWKPILGAIPPLNDADWQAVFNKYKQIPEYHLVNKGMALDAFKVIFWWEWSHRFLGRIIGVAFALPLLGFWLAGKLRHGSAAKYAGLLALGALQGAAGWYMVSSGLVDRVDVSQYRLALHLSIAMMILALLVWLALDERAARIGLLQAGASERTARFARVVLALVAVQIVLGAFVAGLKAGLVYNTWPDMNGVFVPSDYWLAARGWWSLFESLAAAQFNHRIVAYIVVAAALWQAWRVSAERATGAVRSSAMLVALAALLQAGAGIATLLMHVPLSLGLVHQGGAAILLALAVWHLFVTRRTSAY